MTSCNYSSRPMQRPQPSSAKKRRFIKREAASDAGDVDAEPASKITDQQQQQQQAVTAADTVLSVTATSSLLNGHTTVDHQPNSAFVRVKPERSAVSYPCGPIAAPTTSLQRVTLSDESRGRRLPRRAAALAVTQNAVRPTPVGFRPIRRDSDSAESQSSASLAGSAQDVDVVPARLPPRSAAAPNVALATAGAAQRHRRLKQTWSSNGSASSYDNLDEPSTPPWHARLQPWLPQPRPSRLFRSPATKVGGSGTDEALEEPGQGLTPGAPSSVDVGSGGTSVWRRPTLNGYVQVVPPTMIGVFDPSLQLSKFARLTSTKRTSDANLQHRSDNTSKASETVPKEMNRSDGVGHVHRVCDNTLNVQESPPRTLSQDSQPLESNKQIDFKSYSPCGKQSKLATSETSEVCETAREVADPPCDDGGHGLTSSSSSSSTSSSSTDDDEDNAEHVIVDDEEAIGCADVRSPEVDSERRRTATTPASGTRSSSDGSPAVVDISGRKAATLEERSATPSRDDTATGGYLADSSLPLPVSATSPSVDEASVRASSDDDEEQQRDVKNEAVPSSTSSQNKSSCSSNDEQDDAFVEQTELRISETEHDVSDNSPDVDCGTLRANVTEDVTSRREDVATSEFSRDISEVGDVTRISEMANSSCTETATVDTSTLSPAPTDHTVRVPSTEPPSRLTKFIDRRTETLISACATVSTSTVDGADVARDTSDVVDKCKSNELVIAPVLRQTKYRDRKFDVSAPHDCRQLGVASDLTVHRSMLTNVLAKTTTTTTTTMTSVSTVLSPASLTVLRSERPLTETTCSPSAPTASPCSTKSRLTVTLTESTRPQSHRNCRLITRAAAAVSKKDDDVAESGSDSVDDDASSVPVVAQSHPAHQRSSSASGHSVAEGDAQSSKSTVCVLAELSPVTVQPSSAAGKSTSPDRHLPSTSFVSSVAAADSTSTTAVISGHPVFELITSPPPQPAVTSPSPSVKPHRSSASATSRRPAAAPSPPSRDRLCRGAEALVTEGTSVMTALDDALAILTSVVTDQSQNSQAQLAPTAGYDDHDVITPTVDQLTCKSPCIDTRSSCSNNKPGGDVEVRRETEAERRRREIAAAELRRRRWQDGKDDSFDRPSSPSQAPSPPAMFSLPTDSVILRHRRRCRAHAGAVTLPPSTTSTSSSSTTTSSCSSDAGEGDDEADDRRPARHHRISSRARYAARAKRGVSDAAGCRTLTSSKSVEQLSQQHVTTSEVVSRLWGTPQASRRCPVDAAPARTTVTAGSTAPTAAAVTVSSAAGHSKTNMHRLQDSSCRHSMTSRGHVSQRFARASLS